MTRWRITIEYDGAGYVGWQRQDNGPSIQQALEEAIQQFCGETVRVFGAGRTDAGVHALGQVAHFDIQKSVGGDTVRDALNAYLRKQPIVILQAVEAHHSFNARTSARERVYHYRINNRWSPPVLQAGRVWHVRNPLDADSMHRAAQILVGRHDFSSFRATKCQARSPIKTLDLLSVRRKGEEVLVTGQARSFLHHQVRNIVGTLERVGAGKWSAENVYDALAAKDRRAAGPTAPPDGLFLVSVRYKDD
ncbi:MAG: tRNA pseudouridine(38-40) synthase TruA [Pseudomonadota bacterium]|nr:tRNA pseudouridine(38-40) synthase TruA [Pseudomonadota bacterium]